MHKPQAISTKLKIIADKDVFYMFVAMFAVLIGLIYLHQYGYNSDDVAEQTIVKNVMIHGLRDTWLPPDPWFWKYPLYLLLDLIIPSTSRSTILLTSMIMNLALVALVFYSSKKLFNLLKLRGISQVEKWIWLPWVFSISVGFLGFLRMPNTRNFELGLLLLTIALISQYYFHGHVSRFGASKLALSLIVFITGINFLSDPYFFIFLLTFLSVLLGSEAIKNNLNKKKAKQITAFVALSFVSAILIKFILQNFGFYIAHVPTQIIGFNQIASKLQLVYKSYIYLFSHYAPFQSGNIIRTLISVMNIIVGISGVFAGAYIILKKSNKDSLQLALAAQPFIVLMAFFLIAGPNDVATGRYLLLIPIYLVLLMPIAINYLEKKTRSRIVVFIVILLAINILSTSLGAIRVAAGQNPLADSSNSTLGSVSRNKREGAILEALHSAGLTKGYGDYWDSLIINYLSDYNINVGQIICNNKGTVRPYYWVVQDKIYEPKNSIPSFLIFDSRNLNHLACDLSVFGPYKKSIVIDQNTIIFIYDYDVATKFPSKQSLTKPN